MKAFSGIVLAGGKSSRMGRDKMLVPFANETFIGRTVNALRRVAAEVIIASNHTGKYNIDGVREVADVYPGTGPLGGLHAGLLAAKYDDVFAVAGDMPFFAGELAVYLVNRRGAGYDVVAPRIGGRWEPLCAVYSRACIGPIERCLHSGMKKVQQVYPAVKVLAVSEDELNSAGFAAKMFCNVNTPEDLAVLGKQAGK